MMKHYPHLTNSANRKGFTVTLARTGRSIPVPPGRSILAALLDAGVQVGFNCGTGKCGVCEVPVLDGVPDHRHILSREEAGSGGETACDSKVMTCCSGSHTAELVLDL